MRKAIKVYLEQGDLDQLEAWTRARGWTRSRAVRLAVRRLTQTPAEDPILELSGMFEGLPADSSTHFRRHLDATYVTGRP
jgi:hypothetical protein